MITCAHAHASPAALAVWASTMYQKQGPAAVCKCGAS